MPATYTRRLRLPPRSFPLLGPRGTGKTTWLRGELPRARDARSPTESHVVLQAHQASTTHETRGTMAQLVLDNTAPYAAGRPLLTPVC